MPFKESTSTTTSSSVRTSNVQTGAKQFQTTSTTRRKLTRGETAGGLLTTVGQFGMITITLITLSISTALNQFDKDDLEAFLPNYDIQNSYVDVDNPLEHYNYQPFGEDVIDNILGWIIPLSVVGQTVNSFWTNTINFTGFLGVDVNQLGDFIDTFGIDRYNDLSRFIASNAEVYVQLTQPERDWIEDNQLTYSYVENLRFNEEKFHLIYIDIFGFYGPEDYWYWFFTEPSVLTMIELGY
jgi:hypothetical protein